MAEILRQNGFRCAYALEILGWDLGEDSKPRLPGRPMDVKTELVNDARSLDEACYVHEEVMGSSALGGQSREEVLKSMTVAPNQRERERVVAYIGGKAVAFGGFDVVDGIARLWGGCTLREYRRRGCYTAVLRTRCQHAHARGATGALVFGQPDTSALILKRLGFHQAGVTYTYQAEL